ncbi:MAG: protein-glutamate O-methyltransferase CheR [Bacteroidota bacterium]
MKTTETLAIREEDVALLLNELLEKHGYDFTHYAHSSLRRRIKRLMSLDGLPSFAELLYRLRNEANYIQHFVEEITVNVTEMFRDPSLFKTIKETIVPQLATYPLIRVWHAGCASGEEVYSMAILLHEAGLLHKSLLYATDINPAVIKNLRTGIFPLSQMKQYSENYIAAGGKKDYSTYYTAKYDLVKFNPELKKKIIPALHNLVSDRSFNEFHIIFCRNVLIYFDKNLQDHVLSLFDDSMDKRGFLVLGSKENIRFSPINSKYSQWHKGEKIWRRIM